MDTTVTKNTRDRLTGLNIKAYYLLVALSFLYSYSQPAKPLFLKLALTLTALVAVLPVQDFLKSVYALEGIRALKIAFLTAALVCTLVWVWCSAASATTVQKPAPPQPTDQQKLQQRLDTLESQLKEAQARADRVAVEKDPGVDRRLMQYTGVLAAVAIFQFLVLFWQVVTTRASTQKELRAYVFPSSAVRATEHGVLRLKVGFTNSGKTPALECCSWVFEGITNVPNPDFPKTPPAGKETHSSYYIAPGSSTELNEEALPTDQNDFQLISTKIRSLYLVGEIKYKDVFGKAHFTRFRMVTRGNDFVAGIFVFCEEGNQSD